MEVSSDTQQLQPPTTTHRHHSFMDACIGDTSLIHALQSLECGYLTAIASGTDACNAFYEHLRSVLAHAQQLIDSGRASLEVSQMMSATIRSLATIGQAFMTLEKRQKEVTTQQETTVRDILARAGYRRRRKRSTRSRKSKAGKSGKVRQLGKRSKRGRKSPVGNPKRRANAEVDGSNENSKKSRIVTAPPTDSMKFGACRDFFLSHL
ncbi:unnamed protein product, partial [Rhizoctonia solani]